MFSLPHLSQLKAIASNYNHPLAHTLDSPVPLLHCVLGKVITLATVNAAYSEPALKKAEHGWRNT